MVSYASKQSISNKTKQKIQQAQRWIVNVYAIQMNATSEQMELVEREQQIEWSFFVEDIGFGNRGASLALQPTYGLPFKTRQKMINA